MKNTVNVKLVIAFLLFNFTNTSAQETRGNYTTIEIPAPSLKNNLVGTDTIQKIGVYLPPSYSSSKKKYPVVYYLHGYNAKVEESNTGKLEMMENSTAHELIYVEVSGYNLYHGSFYMNSYVTGNWEDFITHDVVSYVDNHYRTIQDRKSRGLVGGSMGGIGAFNISLKHPDKFSAIHLMSPGLGEREDIYNWLFPNDSVILALKKLSDKMEGIPRSKYAESLVKAMDETGDLWLLVGSGVAAVPDTLQPLLMAPLFHYNKEGTFERNDSALAILLPDRAEQVKMYKDTLKLYSYYGMDVGNADQLGFNVKFVKQLSSYLWEEKIPHSTYFSDRDHFSGYDITMENRIIPLMSIYLKGE